MNRTVSKLSILKPRRAFTIIELLVVIGIIVALIAITIPTTVYVREAAKRNTTDQTMAAIRMGLDAYYQQFSTFPDSDPAVLSAQNGAGMLARGLMGFQDFTEDGAGPSNTLGADQTLGFRIVPGGRGKVHGPYVNNDAKYYVQTGTTNAYFKDGWGKAILYYKSTREKDATLVFGTSPGALFITAHNPGAPASGSSKFFSKIGTTSNTLSTGVVPSRESYLLISAGRDGEYFTDDDVVSSR